jgi:hypothetical protein
MILDEVKRSVRSDAFIDEVLFTQFADKVMIIKKNPLMSNRSQFKGDLGRVRDLRNALAHANDYAANPDDARAVCETVRIMDKWIEEFARWLTASTEGSHAIP